jgi:hypothetical protein
MIKDWKYLTFGDTYEYVDGEMLGMYLGWHNSVLDSLMIWLTFEDRFGPYQIAAHEIKKGVQRVV